MVKSDAWAKSKFNAPNEQVCSYCNRICKNLNSLKQHECRCPKNPHRVDYNKLSTYSTNYLKGKSKDTCPEIKKQCETMKQKYSQGYVSPMKGKEGTFKGRHHTEDTKKRIGVSVSESRKQGYANGSIRPAAGIGKGKYCYIRYDDRTFLLRSTYEFIYALHLLSQGIKFEYENIKVPAKTPNRYASTFFCDFNIGDTIVEIKGVPSGKDAFIREAFEAAGYTFVEYFEHDIERFANQLKLEGYDIDEMLDNIQEGCETKNYYVYEYVKP